LITNEVIDPTLIERDWYLKDLHQDALAQLDSMQGKLQNPGMTKEKIASCDIAVTSNFTQKDFEDMVRKAKEHIAAGDIFQVVLSQRFETPFPASRSLDFYRLLRRANPSPYLFHLDFGNGFKLVGASPEVMVGIQNRDILIRPLAGTRKRGASAEEDSVIGQELSNDLKEQAEHRMLVDLARNDVGRFSEPGSVKVDSLMRVEPYGAVLHMATDVRGKLKSGISSFEALLGCLPAGTLSGAPKIRALQIISELEPCQRGPYGGAVGWFTDTDLDTCIFIRSAVITNNKLYWQTGAGIVADSDPTSEYNETLAKSTSIRNVLKQMGGEK
jgi:anthranilate synthase component 1